MEPSMVFKLLLVITVSASSHPLEAPDTTTFSPEEQSKIFFTVPSASANGSGISQAPIKSKSDESLLQITLKIDESDKEIVDSDMGKYLGKAT
jgi:hypothetical protein